VPVKKSKKSGKGFGRIAQLRSDSQEEGPKGMAKGKRGRPRKEQDTIEFWRFARGAMGTCAFDEARERGEKHSVAIREAVKSVKEHSPGMPFSETEMRRTLKRTRPKGSETILRVERKIPTKEDIQKRRSMQKQLARLQGKKQRKSEIAKNPDLEKGTGFTLRFGSRPSYPRHNRKNPPENPTHADH
jgi:hypothetical protein